MRKGVLVLALTCAALSAATGTAAASYGQFSIFDPGEELTGELSPGLRDSALDDADSLGADTIRVLVYWHQVAADDGTSKPAGDSGDPAWPGYGQPTAASPDTGWGKYDQIVRGIVSRGMNVLLVPTGRFPQGQVPRWASNGPGKDGTDPDPNEYGLFMRAIARRYTGGFDPDGPGALAPIPGINYVGVWNEPNSPFYLQPQLKNGAPYTPQLYRALYVAGQRGLREGGYAGPIWIGELAPRGTTTTLGANNFTKAMLCLTPIQRTVKKRIGKRTKRVKTTVGYTAACPALQADGFAHHPHTGVDPPQSAPFLDGDVTVTNLADLERLLSLAAQAGAINPMPIFNDEYGVQTNPPDPLFGRSFQEQAEFLAIAEYIGWRDPDIAAWAQYLLRDDQDQGGFQSGLRLRGGALKDAFAGYRTPLVVRRPQGKCVRKSKRTKKCRKRAPAKIVQLWGHVRPGNGGLVEIERSDRGGAFVPATGRFNTDSAGYFQRKLPYRKGRQFRIVWFDETSGPNICSGNCVGPPTRAYTFK